MNKNIFKIIQSLNTSDFGDYNFLVNELRDVFNQYDEESRDGRLKNLDIEGFEIDYKNIKPYKKAFNDKLAEFVRCFFWAGNEELIRKEMNTNPEILKEVQLDTLKYFMPLNLHDSKFDGPNFLISYDTRETHFKNNIKSGYYLKTPDRNSSSKKNEGCFIATYAFSSYEHPTVKVLRRFRDEILQYKLLGRKFISLYYLYSPRIVKILEKINFPKNKIKLTLCIFIKLLPKRLKN